MAEVVLPIQHHRHTSSIGNMAHKTLGGAPAIEMLPNPNFSFPAMSSSSDADTSSSNTLSAASPRQFPTHLPIERSTPTLAHRRAVSTLPSFSFNSGDASGLTDNKTPPSPRTPDDSSFPTPSRRGHRRGASEFVGGRGMGSALSSSPTRTTMAPLPIPIPASNTPSAAGRRGHAHRRSAAISNHDATSFMKSPEHQSRMSTSLPNTPMELPGLSEQTDSSTTEFSAAADSRVSFEPQMGPSGERSPSRPSVAFSEDVEYIPRPLSTISSGTESSMSTIRGHSGNNSISSMLSLGSQPTPRAPLSPPRKFSGDGFKRRSVENSEKAEREGQWLGNPMTDMHSPDPTEQNAESSSNISFVEPDSPAKPQHEPREQHRKRHSLGYALGLDRRRSEPLLSTTSNDPSRLSTLSLQETNSNDSKDGSKSSTKKLKAWAVSKLSKSSRKSSRRSPLDRTSDDARPKSAIELGSGSIKTVSSQASEPPTAETDLDAVFGNLESQDLSRVRTPPQQIQVFTPTSLFSSPHSRVASDDSPVLDLDAALGPFQTPQLGSSHARRQLHSNRLTRDFGGPGGHYHRRAESAPALAPFDSSRMTSPAQPSMEVFDEEEEDDEIASQPATSTSGQEEEGSVGFQVVDSDNTASASALNWGVDEGLGIRQTEVEADHLSSYENISPRLLAPVIDRRPSSIIEQTIVEEPSPVDGVEIVESFEEPRASSLTKSSDSSETPTLLASQTDSLSAPEGSQMLMTPDTYQTSTFSSPDFSRCQGSFDTSRMGTSASSMTDNRTMSSYATGEPIQEHRVSVDDIPSLTSSRSTMMSTMHADGSRRDFSSTSSSDAASQRAPVDPTIAEERRRKRSSIQSLSQLVGNSFGPRHKTSDISLQRPQTAVDAAQHYAPRKEHNRLKKLMFWKSKNLSKSSLQTST